MSNKRLSFDLTRREFVQTSLAAMTVFALPPTSKRLESHFILKNDSGIDWPVDDPVSWSLQMYETRF